MRGSFSMACLLRFPPHSHPGTHQVTPGIAASVFAQCLHAYLSLLQLFPAPSLNIDSDEPENIPFQYENTRPKRLQLLTVCAIFVCGSMFLFTTSWLHNIGMIENALFSVGREELFDGRSPQPVVALGNVSFLLTGWLTGGFMVRYHSDFHRPPLPTPL